MVSLALPELLAASEPADFRNAELWALPEFAGTVPGEPGDLCVIDLSALSEFAQTGLVVLTSSISTEISWDCTD